MLIIRKYFPDLSSEQLKKIELLGKLFPEWNSKINLISRKDIPFLYERHILHSLSIQKYHRFDANTKIMDVGTGGGFPGLPLAIVNPDANFHLVDSIGKKIMAVDDLIKELKLSNCRAIKGRAEQINDKYHFIISRAVTNFPDFYNLVHEKILKKDISPEKKNGIIYLKGGNITEEIKKFKSQAEIININKYFQEEFFQTKKILYLPL